MGKDRVSLCIAGWTYTQALLLPQLPEYYVEKHGPHSCCVPSYNRKFGFAPALCRELGGGCKRSYFQLPRGPVATDVASSWPGPGQG